VRRNVLVKVVVALAVFTGLGFLFLKTVRDARAEPYTVPREHLSNWTIVVTDTQDSRGAVVALRPPPALPTNLFQQIFRRSMESLTSPGNPGVPLILASEFVGAFAGVVSANDLAVVATEVGLASATIEPVCLVVRRTTGPRETRQAFLLLVEVPGFDRFRDEAARLLASRGGQSGAFDPAAVSPMIAVAGSDSDFQSRGPFSADASRECVAPVEPA